MPKCGERACVFPAGDGGYCRVHTYAEESEDDDASEMVREVFAEYEGKIYGLFEGREDNAGAINDGISILHHGSSWKIREQGPLLRCNDGQQFIKEHDKQEKMAARRFRAELIIRARQEKAELIIRARQEKAELIIRARQEKAAARRFRAGSEERFRNEDAALEYLYFQRWPNGIALCEKCQTLRNHYRVTGRVCYACGHCGSHIFPLSGTIFHKSTTSLATWIRVIEILRRLGGKVSCKQIQRETGVTYKTAWRMVSRVRPYLNSGSLENIFLQP